MNLWKRFKTNHVLMRLAHKSLSSSDTAYLRVTNNGFLELRMFVGMDEKTWKKQVGGRLLSTSRSLKGRTGDSSQPPCALLTGGTCGVFIQDNDKLAEEQAQVAAYLKRI